MPAYNIFRRGILKGTAAMTAFAVVNQATAQSAAPGWSDTGPRELRGQPVPEPPEEKSAGPIRPGRYPRHRRASRRGRSCRADLWQSAVLEFGQYNIPVNALIPGLVDTPLTRYDKRFSEAIGETGRQTPEHPSPQQAWDARAPTVALKVGWLQPDDISPAAVFLASDAAAMVTGAEYEVTGGDSAKNV